MLVVSDTSPVCNLACIGRLQLLRSQFGRVCIPPAVEAELTDLPAAMGGAAIEEASREGRISVRPVEKPELANLLARELHEGESEALVLATQLAADLLLPDERKARRVAQRLHLRVTGTLGVLLRAKYSGAKPSLTAEVYELRAKAGFLISTELEHRILREAGER